jgi:hypothetical protein
MSRSVLGFGIVALGLLGGCDDNGITGVAKPDAGDEGGTFDTGVQAKYSCDAVAENGTCREFTGSDWDLATATGACDVGTIIEGNCPGGAKLGGCGLADGATNEEIEYYYAGDFYARSDVPYLSNSCLGTWVAAGTSTTLGRQLP